MKEDIINILDQQDWDAILIKLMAYSVWLCNVKYKNLPATIEPKELVMDAVEKVYSGIRNWEPEEELDLLAFLRSVVKSHLSNELRTGRHTQTFEEVNNKHDEYFTSSLEDKIYYQQLNESILISMRGDPQVCLVYRGLKDGLKPSEIAEEYGVEINLVRNAQKRLRKIVLKILPSMNKKTVN
jgi:RNA polymerase sigma factor (sigma-70 family)